MLEDVYNEVIADGVHVSYPAIKILASLKADKLILITDAMGAKGVGDGNFSICGKPVVVKHGEVRLADGTLAGSILTLDVALKNVVEKIGLPLDKAINALTVNPAKNLGIFDKYGSISAGKFANFTVLDDDFNVLMTVVKGKIAYIKG
jgi:N-acetylglucosamine-6-phosphate deacetylase